MKSLISFLTAIILTTGYPEAQASLKTENLGFLIQDYIVVSKWDATKGSWINSTKQVAVYDDNNKLVASVVIDAQTDDTISMTRTVSAGQGDVTMQYYQQWRDSEWIDINYMVTEYDEFRRRSTVTTYQLIGGEWVHTARQYNLTYNEINKLASYESQYWTNNEWKTTAIDYYEYDITGDLILQYRILSNGVNSYQAFYTYSNHRMLTRFVQNWQKVTGGWINSYRDTYQYNSCGTRMQFIRERFIGGEWVNEQKTEYFYKIVFPVGEKNRKVAVCHNGQTIYVSINALNAHLAHGDCMGECLYEKKYGVEKNNNANLENPPFIVYPNPAKEMITVRFDLESVRDNKRIELTDFYGKLIRVYTVKDNSDLIIYRGNLLSGQYYLKLIGKEIYSQIVIFE